MKISDELDKHSGGIIIGLVFSLIFFINYGEEDYIIIAPIIAWILGIIKMRRYLIKKNIKYFFKNFLN